MRTRTLVAAGAALVALALVAIIWMTRAVPAGSAAPPPHVADLPATPPAVVSPPEVPPAPEPLAAPAAAHGPAASRGAPATQPWSSVPLALRVSDLGPPLARPVYDGLQKARAAMDRCFQADLKDEAAHPRAPNDEDGWGAAIVTLQMEGRPGELVIVNAPLQDIGTSSMSLVDCCENVLRGFRIPAPAAEPGKRYKLQHQLTQ